MSRPAQQTIAREVGLAGVGVHSGQEAALTFRPAQPDTGVRFRRVDLEGCPEVAATVDNVVATELGTTVGDGEVRVLTIEHVMAALAGLQIDNVLVDIDGPELPIRDGSFQDYCVALEDAGAVEQDAEATVLKLSGVVQAEGSKGASYVATPGPGGLRISATIDFENPTIGRSYGSFLLDPRSFRSEVAPARTFGFIADADALHARGLALGASLENAIVIDDNGVMNDELRFEDEFLRHKVGDVLGDLALLGARIEGHVVADRPSHEGNLALARALRTHERRSGPPVADVSRIMEFMPHRYPMLLVDRVLDVVPGRSIAGLKNVTINEPFFQGHFPGHPIMPGVLIVEAMAQCGCLLLMDQVEDPEDKVVYFMTMDKVKFRQPVTPGDTLLFEVHVVQSRRGVARVAGRGLVDGTVVAEAEFMARIMDR